MCVGSERCAWQVAGGEWITYDLGRPMRPCLLRLRNPAPVSPGDDIDRSGIRELVVLASAQGPTGPFVEQRKFCDLPLASDAALIDLDLPAVPDDVGEGQAMDGEGCPCRWWRLRLDATHGSVNGGVGQCEFFAPHNDGGHPLPWAAPAAASLDGSPVEPAGRREARLMRATAQAHANPLPRAIFEARPRWGDGLSLTAVRPHNSNVPAGIQGFEPACTSPEAWQLVRRHVRAETQAQRPSLMDDAVADAIRVAAAAALPEASNASSQLLWAGARLQPQPPAPTCAPTNLRGCLAPALRWRSRGPAAAAVSNDVSLLLAALRATPPADTGSCNIYGYSALHLAAQCGFSYVCDALLKHGARADQPSAYGSHPVHEAVWNGYDLIVQMLLEAEADPNATMSATAPRYVGHDFVGHTPLHIAGRRGAYGCVGPLLAGGADVIQGRPGDGLSAVGLAAAKGKLEVLKEMAREAPNCLRYADDRGGLLHHCAMSHQLDTLRWLLDQGLDVDSPTKNGETALCIAATEGHQGIVTLLVDRGADVNLRTLLGQTPFHYAASNSHKARILKHLSANPVAYQNLHPRAALRARWQP
jgi:ankyrin repeat protein